MQTKAKDTENLLPGTRFHFSNLLERYATETDKSTCNDLAVYLIKLDWRKFRKHPLTQETVIVKTDNCKKCELPEKPYFSEVNETQVEILPEQKNLEDIFSYYYKKGCKSMPVGILINADKWKGNIHGIN